MLELDAGQLDRLQRVRDDEVIERVLLEVRREAPAWLERRGLLPAIRQLGELRATALELGIEEPGTIERFLLHGLAFPGFRTRRRFSRTCAGRWLTARNNASRTTNGSSSFAWPARNGARTKPRGDRHERHRRAFPTAALHGPAAALRATRAAPAALADAGAAPAAATGPGALPRPVPRPMPVPQTLPRTETGTLSRDRTREAERDCSKSQGRDKDCVECPPSRGEMAIANNGKGHSMSDLSARYQQWVTNFPFPHEWFWSGTWWDGFDEPRCTLLEAKANYAFLFVPLLGVPRPWARAKVKSDLLQKAEVHSDKARPTPPVFVEWHFLQRIVYEYCAAEYLRMGLANLKAFWNPMPGTDEHDDYQETRAKEQEEMKRFCEENPGYCA